MASGASQDQIKEVNWSARKERGMEKRHQPDVEMDDIKASFFRFTSTLPNTVMIYRVHSVL